MHPGWERVKRFLFNPRNLFILGFMIVFVLTFLEVARERHHNFMIFAQSTIDFWNGVNPYGSDWAHNHHDFFLYGPLFSVLFAPFAFLPAWLGPFAWNLFNFTLYFLAIFTLPDQYSRNQKARIFLFTFLILATTQLSFQYNVAVAYLFIFAFSLLERGKAFWAVTLILISGFTKVYGIFELGLLICYPRFWRNMGYVVIVSGVLLLLPMLKLHAAEVVPYYRSWIDSLSTHQDTRTWQTIFYLRPFFATAPPYAMYIQIGSISALAVMFAANFRRFSSFAFRAQSLGILMGWVILLSSAAEKHTYVIALLGYLIWYFSRQPGRIDKILFWFAFLVLVVVPVDLLCPVWLMEFLIGQLQLNLWIFVVIWVRMVCVTFFGRISRL